MGIIQRPIVSEKALDLQSKGVYSFLVEKDVNKIQIKKAVEDFYGVNVQDVRLANYLGKAKTKFSKGSYVKGRKSSFKKAFVKVAEGEVIDIYEA